MTGIADNYDHTPYPAQAYEFCHPSHLGAIARLFGVAAAPAATARILDIGCASGTHLLWLASHLPAAELLGIDFSAVQVNAARTAATAQGLTNVHFEQADLLDFDPGPVPFDYIIAHGFLSWVPDPVKQRLLEFCRDHLAGHGVAFISYNCYPGWHLQEGLRMLAQTEPHSPAEPCAGVERMLHVLEQAKPAYAQAPHGALLDSTLRRLRAKPHDVLIHDELGPVNDPCYFLQFVGWAGECGLHYLGDADFATDWPDAWPESLRNVLREHGYGRLHAQQYLDFVANRSFRQSLLCRADRPTFDRPDPLAVESLWVRSKLRTDSPIRLAPKVCLKYYPDGSESPNQAGVAVDDPLLQSVLWELSQPIKRFRPVAELFRHGMAAGAAGLDRQVALQRLGLFILSCQAQGWMELSTMDRPAPPRSVM